ncbi:MAG: SdrD B-like domain-containing protein, partial [Cyanobacteria bacterium J06638_38]
SGVTIFLDLNNDESLDPEEPSTTTNDSGEYIFTDLDAGNYIIREVTPTGFIQTFPLSNDDVTGDGFADVVLEYFDSGAGPIPGPYGQTEPGFGIEPVPLDVVLGDDIDGERDFLSLPTGSFVTVGFTDEVGIDGPDDDIFVLEEGVAGDRADVFVSSNLIDFTFLGTGNGGTTSSFDLADIGFTEPVRAIRVVGLDNAGTAPGFDLVNVRVLPESIGEATGANVVTLAENDVIEDLNFGNFELFPDNVSNSLSSPTDLGFLIGTQIVSDSIGGVDLYDFFRFELLENSEFDLQSSNLSADAEIALLDSSGLPLETISVDDGIEGLIDEDLESGIYYIRVLRFDIDSTPYTLELTGTPIPQPFQILSVTPDEGSNAGQSTITISGNQFTPEANVSLIDNAGNEQQATSVTWLDSETLSATFDLVNSAVDSYDVRVVDNPGMATIEDAFDVSTSDVGG